MADAVAPVSLMASATLAKTGLPRCSEPAFFGFVPPTTFVPVFPYQFRSLVIKKLLDWAHTVLDRLLCVKAVAQLIRAVLPSWCLDSRSLLSREALEEHFGVAVDAEVLDSLGILRRTCCVLPGRGPGERRAQGVSESLHRDCGAVTNAKPSV